MEIKKPTFTTLNSFSINYGTRNFIEVALKATEGGEHFVSFSKGYTDQGGNKRYKRSLGFQVDDKVIEFLIDKLTEIKKEAGKAPKKEKKEEKEEKKEEKPEKAKKEKK